ncbi:putative hydroxypyruvate isomerase [Bicyclus anynana]|uniref:Putative hydroxypyruvate isomerase n=1 Tax=Bicyclus anynana TaxID=110368 RepID=A0A6J1P0E4_BICAN|nr:putative hydroxypyruvate isomerase [Bicyclus anynana]
MKFCANLAFMFTESASILERYALAKDAGFKAVETGFPLGYSIEQVKHAKEAAGVEQVLINLKTGDVTKGELGVTAVPGKETEFQENLRTTIEYAKAVGARKIHIMAGKLETVSPQNWTTYENNLKYAADVLKTQGILGVIEPINQHSVPKYFLSDYKKAVDIIKRLDSDHLKLQLDIFHLQHISGDLSHNIQNLMPYVGHIQIAQVPNRNEPDTAGEINYQYIIEHIQNSGYSDWIGLEYKPAGNTKNGLKWIQDFGYNL